MEKSTCISTRLKLLIAFSFIPSIPVIGFMFASPVLVVMDVLRLLNNPETGSSVVSETLTWYGLIYTMVMGVMAIIYSFVFQILDEFEQKPE
ncbi:MAG: hypothetical protein WA989_01995 [Henriciella sp.]|uniref:hypothetical protein n=1 Tax=Henriciella sp. TaxID=1968823 RepID=UPI003C756697